MDSLRTKGGRAFFMKLLRSDGVRETQQPEAGRETRTRFVIRYVYEMILDLFKSWYTVNVFNANVVSSWSRLTSTCLCDMQWETRTYLVCWCDRNNANRNVSFTKHHLSLRFDFHSYFALSHSDLYIRRSRFWLCIDIMRLDGAKDSCEEVRPSGIYRWKGWIW